MLCILVYWPTCGAASVTTVDLAHIRGGGGNKVVIKSGVNCALALNDLNGAKFVN